MLKLDKLCFGYQSQILDEISLEVTQGEIVAIIGPSGSGKTTLFQLISGINTQGAGTISILGEFNPQIRSQLISYMMQEDLLLPWKSLLDNMLIVFELENKFSLFSNWKMRKKLKGEFTIKALKMLEEVGLEGFEDYFPDQLSGGMRQRASLARSLLFSKPLLLLDEPFGAVDYFKRQDLYKLMKKLQKKYSLTILFITHDLFDAKVLANRIFLLYHGELVPYQFQEGEKAGQVSLTEFYELVQELR